MSERLDHKPRTREHLSSPEVNMEAKKHLEVLKQKAEEAERAERQHHNIEHLKEQAETFAKSREETRQPDQEEKQTETTFGLGRELKNKAYKTTMRRVRSHLKPTARAFSKLIHQPTVDAVSEVGAKTIARPSGILGGGFVALIGSCFVLFMARRYGFRYNFFVYIGFLLIGFVLGLAIDLLVHSLHRRKL